MSEIKLKPCPFCGSKVKKVSLPFLGTQMFICKRCGADVCFNGAEYGQKAVDAWNRRIEKTKEKAGN